MSDSEPSAEEGPDSPPDEGPEPSAEEPSEPAPEEPSEPSPEERLDDLQDRIDAARTIVNEGTELEEEQRFIESGEESEPDEVDDTIAPPG